MTPVMGNFCVSLPELIIACDVKSVAYYGETDRQTDKKTKGQTSQPGGRSLVHGVSLDKKLTSERFTETLYFKQINLSSQKTDLYDLLMQKKN